MSSNGGTSENYQQCQCGDLISRRGETRCRRCRTTLLEPSNGAAEAVDNWKHRSAGMTCSTCMWFMEKRTLQGEAKIGRCRRRAPTLNGWPAMKLSDWCGDHKLDEEKISGDA